MKNKRMSTSSSMKASLKYSAKCNPLKLPKPSHLDEYPFIEYSTITCWNAS